MKCLYMATLYILAPTKGTFFSKFMLISDDRLLCSYGYSFN